MVASIGSSSPFSVRKYSLGTRGYFHTATHMALVVFILFDSPDETQTYIVEYKSNEYVHSRRSILSPDIIAIIVGWF